MGIVWDLTSGLICWPFYGPKKLKHCPTKTQKKSVFQQNQYKIWWKRHLSSFVDLLLSLLYMKWWELFEIWYQGSFVGLSMDPRRSYTLPYEGSKEVHFQGKSIRNLVEMSFLKTYFWAFYTCSGENWLRFDTEGPAIGLLGDPMGSKLMLRGPKPRLILSEINKKSLISNIL